GAFRVVLHFPTRASSDLVAGEGFLGIAGHEDETDVRILLAQLGQQGRSVHLRHDDIGDHQIDGAAELPVDLQRLGAGGGGVDLVDRKSTRLNSSHVKISY